MEGQLPCLSDKTKRKEFPITEPLFCEMLKGLVQEKEDQTYEHPQGQ